MKKTILIIAALMLTACDKDDAQPQPVDTPVVVETPAASPTPEAPKAGVWCKASRGDFSPCNPADVPVFGTSCKVGEKFTGCKGAADCLEKCN